MQPILIWRFVRQQRVPGQLIIQLTDRCNATCPQCGMRVTEAFPRTDLETDAIKRMIDAAAARHVQALSFTGGEPLLCRDRLMDLIQYAGRAGIPYIRTGTNGFVFRGADRPGFADKAARLADQLAATPLRNFWISIDSAEPEVHETMRGFPGVIHGIEKALPLFHERGLYPAANLGINRNIGGSFTRQLSRRNFSTDTAYLQVFSRRFQESLHRFYRFVIDLGFTMVNTCYPMSVESGGGLNPVYAATAADDVVRFSSREKAALYQALIETIPAYRSRIRIFTPLCSLYELIRQHDCGHGADHCYACRGGRDFFFVGAGTGDTYPCGYRGNESLGNFLDVDLDHPALKKGDCRRCDWECFRDPSALFGPLLDIGASLAELLRDFWSRKAFYQIWLKDLLYYRACHLFDGRRPPNFSRMKRGAGNKGVPSHFDQ